MCWAPKPWSLPTVSSQDLIRMASSSHLRPFFDTSRNPVVDFYREAYQRVERGSQMSEDLVLANLYRKQLASFKVTQLSKGK